MAVQFCFASGIGLQDDGEIDAPRSHQVWRGIDHSIRNTPGLQAAQPSRILDVDGPADARIPLKE